MAITLKKKKDFKRVFGSNALIKGVFFILRYAANGDNRNQFAYIISKKQVSKATARNKIKRRLKELIRTNTTMIKKGIDGVFIVKSAAQKAGVRELREEINKVLNRTNI